MQVGRNWIEESQLSRETHRDFKCETVSSYLNYLPTLMYLVTSSQHHSEVNRLCSSIRRYQTLDAVLLYDVFMTKLNT